MQWLMLQQNEPDDYVISTGRQFSVRQFVTMLPPNWAWRSTGAARALMRRVLCPASMQRSCAGS
ncbi:GDP-mannose 4,6-dehydratase [Desulfocurvibacter africanus]|uniref:GDP-mannose 4,6-dehydratase n=1 Tax=Desulfocurvibacter africanus TaxID=873 RepID=UPI003A4D842B